MFVFFVSFSFLVNKTNIVILSLYSKYIMLDFSFAVHSICEKWHALSRRPGHERFGSSHYPAKNKFNWFVVLSLFYFKCIIYLLNTTHTYTILFYICIFAHLLHTHTRWKLFLLTFFREFIFSVVNYFSDKIFHLTSNGRKRREHKTELWIEKFLIHIESQIAKL